MHIPTIIIRIRARCIQMGMGITIRIFTPRTTIPTDGIRPHITIGITGGNESIDV